jgi:hypothetical protein
VAAREWLELFALRDVDLNNLAVVNMLTQTRRASVSSPDCVRAAMGTHFVLGSSRDPAANGGVPVGYAFASGFDMYSSAAAIALDLGGTIIDTGMYPTVPSNVSVQVTAPMSMSAAGNDTAASWCASTTTGVFSGTGTPGAANIACP